MHGSVFVRAAILSHLFIGLALAEGRADAATESAKAIIVAAEGEPSKCFIMLDGTGQLLSSYYVDKRASEDGPLIWQPGDKLSIHCSIELSPFRLLVVQTSHGSSVRISRDGKLAAMDSIKFGIHGDDGNYAAIVRMPKPTIAEALPLMESLTYGSLKKFAEANPAP